MFALLQRAGRASLCHPAALCAAAASSGPGSRAASTASSAAPEAELHGECLYSILEVPPSASPDQLKAAFRRKAKELHPDALAAAGGSTARAGSGGGGGSAAAGPANAAADRAAFVRLLAAYQVLSDPRSRQLYDLSRDASGARVLRAAAASGVAGGAAYEDIEVDVSWGLGGLFKQPPSGTPAALDKVRQELQSELHSAMRRAYLGPKLDDACLGGGRLPDAFEADERAEAGSCPDLLQLVSGRQLLGAVRERQLELLARQQAAVAAVLGHEQGQGWRLGATAVAAALPGPCSHGGTGEQQSAAAAGGLAGAGHWMAAAAAVADCSTQDAQQQQQQQQREGPQSARAHLGPGQQQRAQDVPIGHQQSEGASNWQQQGQQQQQRHRQRDPDILDLVIGEKVVATAVRHFPLPHPPGSSCTRGGGTSSTGTSASSSAGVWQAAATAEAPGDVREQAQQAQQQAQQQQGPWSRLPAEVIGIYSAGGQLLAQVEAAELDPGSATASTARVLDGAGRHTHTLFRTQTPLVRHITFAAELASSKRSSSGGGGGGGASSGGGGGGSDRLVICRARRAWLPPSSLWLFKPRSYSHDIGGWYIEWAGHTQHAHPAWLDPAVFVLTAAFDSLDHERASRQPLGLFGRLRAASEAGEQQEGAAQGSAASGTGGWRAWLGSALRFHGYWQR